MAWTTEMNTALDKWLAPDTWYKGHALDMRRFYDFVHSAHEGAGSIDEGDLSDRIVARVADLHEVQIEPDGNPDLSQVVRQRVSLAVSILEYLEQPPSFVDRT